jgi:hypothetical protein
VVLGVDSQGVGRFGGLFQFVLANVQENYRRILKTAERIVVSVEQNRHGSDGGRQNSSERRTMGLTPENETSQVEFQEQLTAKSLKVPKSHGKTQRAA